MKKILLVYDQPGWAFYYHCVEIKKRLSEEYFFDMVDHRQNIPEISKKFDLTYVLDPMPLPYGYSPSHKTVMGLRNEFLFREHPGGPKSLYENGFPGRCVSLKDHCCILHVVNRTQMKVFKEIVLDKPLILCQHGIDETLFDKNKYIKKQNDILTAGVSGRDSDNKGFGHIKNACDKSGIKFLSAQYQKGLKKEQMPSFYDQLDVYVCFSKSEGQNNPIMEIGGMGIPPISTMVGTASEMIIDGVSGLLIDRSVDSLVIALNKMKDKKLRDEMGNKFHEEIMKNWTWKVKIEDFRKMFKMFFEMK